MRMISCGIVVAGLVAGVSLPVMATQWQGGIGNWDDDGSWDAGEPVSTNNAYISNGGTAIVSMASEACYRLYIGDNNSDTKVGSLRVTNGHLTVNSVYCGYQSGGTGTVSLTGGTLTFAAVNSVGYNGGAGYLLQTDGTNYSSMGNLYIGNGAGSTGSYELVDGYCSVRGIYLGDAGGNGWLVQRGGTMVSARASYIGDEAGSVGTCTVEGGKLRVVRNLEIGCEAGSVGTANFRGGEIDIGYLASFGYKVYVGINGVGTLNLGTGAGTCVMTSRGTAVIVRENAEATGTVQGWGTFNFSEHFCNNGRVIADGYGLDHALDLSSFSSITNAIDNLSSNGWFAVNGGKLVLPEISVAGGNNVYNWGEAQDDAAIDMVNSLRTEFADVATPRTMTVSLHAPDRTDVPPPPPQLEMMDMIGIWKFDISDALTFSSLDLTFRYDDDLRVRQRMDIARIRLYHYDGTRWSVVPMTLTEGNKTIEATVTSLGGTSVYYAVGDSPPEGTIIMFR